MNVPMLLRGNAALDVIASTRSPVATQSVASQAPTQSVGATSHYKWKEYDMARCTAPVNGHRTASAAAACPACRSRYSGYRSYSYSPSSYSSSGSSGSSVSGSASSGKPRWSRPGSSVVYTPAEVRTLTPVRENVEKRAAVPDLRDVFLCHVNAD